MTKIIHTHTHTTHTHTQHTHTTIHTHNTQQYTHTTHTHTTHTQQHTQQHTHTTHTHTHKHTHTHNTHTTHTHTHNTQHTHTHTHHTHHRRQRALSMRLSHVTTNICMRLTTPLLCSQTTHRMLITGCSVSPCTRRSQVTTNTNICTRLADCATITQPNYAPHAHHRLQRVSVHQTQPLLADSIFTEHHKAPTGCMVLEVVGCLACVNATPRSCRNTKAHTSCMVLKVVRCLACVNATPRYLQSITNSTAVVIVEIVGGVEIVEIFPGIVSFHLLKQIIY